MSKLINRQVGIQIRNVDEESRTAEFVISTEALDTYGTVFKAAGAVLDRYQKNPIVTYQHEDWSRDPDDVIGTSELRLENNQWIARATFEDLENDMNEKAEKIFRKVKKGTLRMASIIAAPIEGGWGVSELGEDPDAYYFRKWELYSWSVVTHGSNPEALKRSVEALEEFKEKNPGESRATEENKEENNPRAEEPRDGITARILQLKSI